MCAVMTRTRETIDSKTFEAAILLLEWAQTAIGCEGWVGDSYANEIASTTHLLILCLDAGNPFRGHPNYTNNWSVFATGQLCRHMHLMP